MGSIPGTHLIIYLEPDDSIAGLNAAAPFPGFAYGCAVASFRSRQRLCCWEGGRASLISLQTSSCGSGEALLVRITDHRNQDWKSPQEIHGFIPFPPWGIAAAEEKLG